MKNTLRFAVCLGASALIVACGNTTLVEKQQQQAVCGSDGGYYNAIGECVQCVADANCPPGEVCDLISGTCVPEVVVPYDGGPGPVCESGAVRCSSDLTAVQTCLPIDDAGDNGWQNTTQCQAGQTCNPATLTCAICRPGSTSCNGQDGSGNFYQCSQDGTTWQQQPCGAGAHCVTQVPADAGVSGLAFCQLCTPNTQACTQGEDGGTGVLTCDETGNTQTFTSCWPTNVCNTNAAGKGECLSPTCTPSYENGDGGVVPAEAQCVYTDGGQATSGVVQGREVCNANGTAWTTTDPSTGFNTNCTGSTLCATDSSGSSQCLNACQIAENSDSYFGCDYWAAVLSNSELQEAFTTDGTSPSDFALDVSNVGTVTAHAQVTDSNGNLYGSATIAPGSNAAIPLAWREICGTGQANFGYHLTTDVPVTVYQFNPLHSALPENTSCTPNNCNGANPLAVPDCCPGTPCSACKDKTGLDQCVPGSGGNNECESFSFSNDASLLLPTHLLGSSYVVVSQDHESSYNLAQNTPLPGFMAVVATQNNTVVQIFFAGHSMSTQDSASLSSAGICKGPPHGTYGNIAEQQAGSSQTYNMSAGDVLHFWTANAGGAPTCVPNIEAGETATGKEFESCLWPNDFTGSIVTSVANSNGVAEPIAVFGGADCTFKPYNYFACDHIEEEMFPFNTWGTDYVGTHSAPYQGTTSAYPDYWRIVSACGTGSCPNGPTITITPPIAAEDVGGTPVAPNHCSTSGNTTTCTLPALTSGNAAPWFEFMHASAFSLHSDQPITLAGYHVGEQFAGCSSNSGEQDPKSCTGGTVSEGDPDLMLMPPVEQWRTNYNFLAPTTYKDNYANLMLEDSDGGSCVNCGEIQLDGVPVTSGWSNIPGTKFWANTVKLSAGANNGGHQIVSVTSTGTAGPSVGVLVYGYDSYVSYGYTGGLNLQQLVSFTVGG